MLKDKKITLPTLFTFIRIALVPFIVKAIVSHQWGWSFGLILIAALTDTIDGNLARLLGEQSFFGACLDPIADKFLVLSCFFTLAFVQTPFLFIPPWFFWIVLIKELLLVCGALGIYLIRGEILINPTWLGKVTTLVQLIFILWLFLCPFFHWVPVNTFYVLLALILLLVVATLVQYTVVGLRMLFRFLL